MLNEKQLLYFFFFLWNKLDDKPLYQKEKSKYLAKNNSDMVDKIYKISKDVFKSFSEIYNKSILEIEKREKIKENEESKTIIEKLEDIFLDLANHDSKEEDIFIALFKIDRGIFIPYTKDYFNPYYNAPSFIGESQTCSAPYMVLSYNLLSKIVQDPKKIFEAGVGSGYQIANFAMLYPESELFGIDIHKSLCETSIKNIKKVDEMKGYDLSKIIKIEQGNALKLEENNLFKKNSPYDLIYFTFMLPLGYNIKNLAESEYLNKGGAIIAPVCEEICGNLRKHLGCLNLVQKIHDKEILSTKVGYVSFVPAING